MACLLNHQGKMTFKIQKDCNGQTTTIRLIGRIESEHLSELKAQTAGLGQKIVLDLTEVTLVDVDVIRFLAICEDEGIEVLHCSAYIEEWIRRERHHAKNKLNGGT